MATSIIPLDFPLIAKAKHLRGLPQIVIQLLLHRCGGLFGSASGCLGLLDWFVRLRLDRLGLNRFRIDRLAWLDRIDGLHRLDGLDRIDRLDWLDRNDGLDRLRIDGLRINGLIDHWLIDHWL